MSSLLLTKLKKQYPYEPLRSSLFWLLVIFCLGIVYIRSCSNQVPNKKYQFNPETAARAINPVTIDTTKPTPINHKYKLQGSDTLFQILWNQITSPLDVTPRQTEVLKQWLQAGIKQDTISKK